MQDINQKTARREFCGPHKRIAQSVMEQLDRDIEDARDAGNRVLKKVLKRKHVGSIQSSVIQTDRLTGKSSSSWALETATSKKASKEPMPRKFPEEGWKYSACLTQRMRSFRKRETLIWFVPAESRSFVGSVIPSLQARSSLKRNTSSNRHYPASSILLSCGQSVPQLVQEPRMAAGQMNQFMSSFKT